MRINIGQTTNLFHVDVLNRSMNRNTIEKEGAVTMPRKDVAVISAEGRAASILQNIAGRMEVGQEGQDYLRYQIENGTYGAVSTEKVELKWFGQEEALYDHIIKNSDDGFNRPTVASQLRGTYSGYLNEAVEQERPQDVSVYKYIANSHVDSLAKAYQDVYNDIVSGYEDGTREVWTQNFDEGADYTEFEYGGKIYRFHRLTQEEELAQLNKAYEEAARDVEDRVNALIDQADLLAKVMPEYMAKMASIEVEIARREGIEIGEENIEAMLERIKNMFESSESTPERFNIYEMLMEARKNWLGGEE